MSWRTRRPDTPRIELMAIQLQEAKDLLDRDTATHARLAFILLDNAAEVMMFRNIESLLFYNPMYEHLVERWEETLLHTDDAEAQAQHDEIKAKVISKTKRTKLERSFDAKVNFLVENDRLDPVEGRVIKKFHGYRNELYHRDYIRAATVRTASLLYFQLACSLFEHGDEYPIGDPINQKTSPTMERYSVPGDRGRVPSAATTAAHLRFDLGLDAASLKETLITHLTSRLDKMEADIAWAGERLSGLWPDAIIRLAQLPEGTLPDSLQQLIAVELKYCESDLDRWRQAVEELRALDGELGSFAAFADIEDDFEPLEVLVDDLVARIDHEIEVEADNKWGK